MKIELQKGCTAGLLGILTCPLGLFFDNNNKICTTSSSIKGIYYIKMLFFQY